MQHHRLASPFTSTCTLDFLSFGGNQIAPVEGAVPWQERPCQGRNSQIAVYAIPNGKYDSSDIAKVDFSWPLSLVKRCPRMLDRAFLEPTQRIRILRSFMQAVRLHSSPTSTRGRDSQRTAIGHARNACNSCDFHPLTVDASAAGNLLGISVPLDRQCAGLLRAMLPNPLPLLVIAPCQPCDLSCCQSMDDSWAKSSQRAADKSLPLQLIFSQFNHGRPSQRVS
jgi:hypothetical protein